MVSWLAFWRAGAGWPRAVFASGAGFAPAPIALIVWLSYHPTVLPDTLERYRILETHRAPSDQGRLANLGAAAPGYVSYFGWTFLFRVGAPNITMATGLTGVFLLPVALLFPVGLFALWRRRDPIPSWPIVAALAFAPLLRMSVTSTAIPRRCDVADGVTGVGAASRAVRPTWLVRAVAGFGRGGSVTAARSSRITYFASLRSRFYFIGALTAHRPMPD